MNERETLEKVVGLLNRLLGRMDAKADLAQEQRTIKGPVREIVIGDRLYVELEDGKEECGK